MKISERSWHLRWVRWWWRAHDRVWWFLNPGMKPLTYTPTNLCMHFWSVTFDPALMVLQWVTLVAPLLLLKWVFKLLQWLVLHVFLRPIAFAVNALHDRRGANVERQPNLFVEYVKAKKRKVCPLIEVVP